MAFSISKSYTPSSGQVADASSYNTDISALFDTLNGLQNQTTTIGGLTITPSANGTTKFLVNNASGTAQFAIDTTNSEIVDTSTLGIKSTYGLFRDRGDPGALDFAVGSVTADGAWHDMDLSTIVPAGAKAVCLGVSINDNATGSYVAFREKGNSNAINRAVVSTQAVDVAVYADVIVACSTARVIEFFGTNSSFTAIDIVVKGWWK